jgi:hypothetical protein
MIVLLEDPEHLPPGASADDLRRSAEAARIVGWRVFTLPPEERGVPLEDALAYLTRQEPPVPGVFLGFIPDLDRYRELYAGAAGRGILLPNDPEQHRRAMELDRALPALGELTPETVVVRAVEESDAAGETVGYPVFVKGALRSDKEEGWEACVARDPGALRERVARLLARPGRTRGAVLVRRLVPLRHVRTSGKGFPVGREYRVFVLAGEVLAHGYYWDGEDPLAALAPDEEAAVHALASETARRLDVPYLAVDVGQAEDGRWLVVEVNDPQCAGLSQVPPLVLWHRLRERLAS